MAGGKEESVTEDIISPADDLHPFTVSPLIGFSFIIEFFSLSHHYTFLFFWDKWIMLFYEVGWPYL